MVFLRYSLNKDVTFNSEILEDTSGMASQDREEPQRPQLGKGPSQTSGWPCAPGCHRLPSPVTLLWFWEHCPGQPALEGCKGHVSKSSEVEANGQIGVEFNFSDNANCKRLPLLRKLGERPGLQPSLQRPEARQENAPEEVHEGPFSSPRRSYNLRDPKFHPFVGGGEVRPPERPWNWAGPLGRRPRLLSDSD